MPSKLRGLRAGREDLMTAHTRCTITADDTISLTTPIVGTQNICFENTSGAARGHEKSPRDGYVYSSTDEDVNGHVLYVRGIETGVSQDVPTHAFK